MENNIFSLSRKTALVTGGSRGSGVVFVYGSYMSDANDRSE